MADAQINLSASQAVRRITGNDNIALYFQQNSVPLFQGIDPNTYAVTPTWSEASNYYPIITPKVSSSKKNSVTLTNHVWKYNGTVITFASGSGWVASTNFDGTFKMNTADGSLAIVKNLASKTNQDTDILNYSGTAMLGSSSYPMEKSIDVMVAMLGGSSYYGGISATSTVLTRDVSEATLTTWLFNAAGGNVTGYTCTIYRGTESEANKAGTSDTGIFTIHRDKTGDTDKLYVDSHQLFIITFALDGAVVYRAGIDIDDIADMYQLTLISTGEVDNDSNQTFRCKITNTNKSTGETEITPTSASVVWAILDNNLQAKRTETQDWATMTSTGFVVKDADTRDDDQNIISVTVNCDVEAVI